MDKVLLHWMSHCCDAVHPVLQKGVVLSQDETLLHFLWRAWGYECTKEVLHCGVILYMVDYSPSYLFSIFLT